MSHLQRAASDEQPRFHGPPGAVIGWVGMPRGALDAEGLALWPARDSLRAMLRAMTDGNKQQLICCLRENPENRLAAFLNALGRLTAPTPAGASVGVDSQEFNGHFEAGA